MKKNGWIIAAATVLLLIGTVLVMRRIGQNRPVTEETSPDGEYVLEIIQRGEPDFPYGATHCRLILKSGRKKIVKYDFDIHDDGANADPANFEIGWEPDGVNVLVSGDEQEPLLLTVSFNGAITVR